MEKDSISVDLVLQREVEGDVFSAFVVVNLHSGGVLIGLEVLDDIREPHREPVEPGHRDKVGYKRSCALLDRQTPHTVCIRNSAVQRILSAVCSSFLH